MKWPMVQFHASKVLKDKGLVDRCPASTREIVRAISGLTGEFVPRLRTDQRDMIAKWLGETIDFNAVLAAKRARRRAARDQKRGKDFYATREWYELRYRAIKRHGSKCQCCGNGGEIHVDHIKPRSKFPEYELDIDNLQVLCKACNLGKSNKDSTDWRPPVTLQ